METKDSKFYKLIVVVSVFFIISVCIILKLFSITSVDGDKYRALAEKQTLKNQVIDANRGSIYADDGSLLATSVPKYTIRWDAVTVSDKNFELYSDDLCDSLASMFSKSASYYKRLLKKARHHKSRGQLIARDIGYLEYLRLKRFPLFEKGAFKGGIIVEPKTIREHPLGGVARRTIGYKSSGAGIEGAFDTYLKGVDGRRKVQRIGKNQYKPVNDKNEIEPQNGLDVVTTLNVNIQDVVHNALKQQLEYFEAAYGSAIVMETKTGDIKAISNLKRNTKGEYKEHLNYAVGAPCEPGSTFKLMVMVAALEAKVIDDTTLFDTENGVLTFYDKYKVRDSKVGGYGVLSAAQGFEKSSNTVFTKIVQKGFKDNPKAFVNRLYNMGLNEKLGLEIKGEGQPEIPHPDDEKWSGISLPWMSYGYGVVLTPLQILTFYNAIANDGEMVKPRFVKEIRNFKSNEPIKSFDKQVLNPKVCSMETITKVKRMMANVVKTGTAKNIYNPNFSMAGKTGTCRTDYGSRGKVEKHYIASFAGYFPADNPKYSCMVIIHRPKNQIGYYGNVVAAPVFKKIAKQIYTHTPIVDKVNVDFNIDDKVISNYERYHKKSQKKYNKVPNLKGMALMDAIPFIENMGMKVKTNGIGKVKSQSVKAGEKIVKGKLIVLKAS